MTFREAYCALRGVSPEAFEEAVLRECLFRRRRWLARLVRGLRPAYFATDLDLVHAAGDCATLACLGSELNAHRYRRPVRGLWRRTLRVRLSGEALLALGAELLP